MRLSDRYHKWVEWSEEDAVYLGKCPDLITGIHVDDPVKLYAELHEVVEDVTPLRDRRTSPSSSRVSEPPKRMHLGIGVC